MSSLNVRDLIHRLITNDPILVASSSSSSNSNNNSNSTTSTSRSNSNSTSTSTTAMDCYYSISSENSSDPVDDDVVLLALLLPVNSTIRSLRFEGPTSPIKLYLWRHLMEALLCHNSLRDIKFVDGTLNLFTTKVIANVLRYNSCTITHLDLSGNDSMEMEGVISILESLKYNRILQYLEFEYSLRCCCENASHTELERLCRTLRELIQINDTLHYIGLDYNNLSSFTSSGLMAGLLTNRSIERINYRENNIQSLGAIQFAIALHYNGYLTSLDLTGNNIGDDGAIAIAETLRYRNTSLQIFYFYDNYITLSGFSALANVLKTNTSLEEYGISSNHPNNHNTTTTTTNTTTTTTTTTTNESHFPILLFLDALQYNTTLKTLNIDPPNQSLSSSSSKVIWDTVRIKIIEMLDYNDTIGAFWSNWHPPYHHITDDTNQWIIIQQDDEQPKRIAPKKRGRQRSDTYHWLFRTWILQETNI